MPRKQPTYIRPNLINGEKPEFGNPKHIEWLKNRQAELSGVHPVGGLHSYYTGEHELHEASFYCPRCSNPVRRKWRHSGKIPASIICPTCSTQFAIDPELPDIYVKP